MNDNYSMRKYTDAALWGLLDALVSEQGRVAAGNALGVNYRTLQDCLDNRQLGRRMREALREFGNLAPVVGERPPVAGVVNPEEGSGKTLSQLMADLEADNRDLRKVGEALAQEVADLKTEIRKVQETNETQAAHLKDRDRWMVPLVQGNLRSGIFKKMGIVRRARDRDAIIAGFAGPPEAGVLTLNHQLGEEQALGRAAHLVDEWREVSWRAAISDNRLEQAEARVRKLQLEKELIEEFDLTLPPYTEPWDFEARDNESHKRRSDLVYAIEELEKAKRGQSRGV